MSSQYIFSTTEYSFSSLPCTMPIELKCHLHDLSRTSFSEMTFDLLRTFTCRYKAKPKKQKAVETWLRSPMSASLKVENILDEILAKAILQRQQIEQGQKYRARAFFSNHNPFMVRSKDTKKIKKTKQKLDRIAGNRSRLTLLVMHELRVRL
ncbi:hypothetical protein OSB04_026540 [Centaurea solstitialis]|uniref:Uncharacterized protein n=1 Tax=Centaurea solstitialis TaxID=347529 RepID=A0AA38W7C2_9ASTR|nr:hypothetical protein OSB04_026540 [Centaurea solstitialis]